LLRGSIFPIDILPDLKDGDFFVLFVIKKVRVLSGSAPSRNSGKLDHEGHEGHEEGN
jgi:hypothetical protein